MKVHYIGWGEEYDEWKEEQDVIDLEPDTNGMFLDLRGRVGGCTACWD